VAVGADTAISASDQSSDASTGCCIGQTWMSADGLGTDEPIARLVAALRDRTADESPTKAVLRALSDDIGGM
jgi:hypothetical protein